MEEKEEPKMLKQIAHGSFAYRYRAPKCDYIYYINTSQLVRISETDITTIAKCETVVEANQAIKKDMEANGTENNVTK